MVVTFLVITAMYTAFLILAISLMALRLKQMRDYFVREGYQAGFNMARRTKSWSVQMHNGCPALAIWGEGEGDLKKALTSIRREMSAPPKPTFRDDPSPYDA